MQPLERLPLWWIIANRSAALLNRAGLLSLTVSPEKFLDSPRVRRGVAVIGDDQFTANLRDYLRVFQRYSALTYLGLHVLRGLVDCAIQQRVTVEQQLEAHPEILEVPITCPIFIVGFPRSGTTLLQSLLLLHPGCRWLRQWELALPFPTNREDWGTSADRRRADHESWLKRVEEHPTLLNAIHPDDSPEECARCLWPAFYVHAIFLYLGLRGYLPWWHGVPGDAPENAYRFYRKHLQYLSWVEPGCHWVLKSPEHMIDLDALLCVFPDARVIQLHRDPRQVVPSLSSLVVNVQFGLTRDSDAEIIGQQVLELLGEWSRRNIALRRGLKAENFYDVYYDRTFDDPLAVVHMIYDRFGMEYPVEMEHRMTSWLAQARPQSAGPPLCTGGFRPGADDHREPLRRILHALQCTDMNGCLGQDGFG